MRKIILSMLLLLAGATTYAQVGINKEVPQATLDINAQKENTVSDKVEGLLIPRVSKEKAHKMGENVNLQESTMIYVNDLSTSFSVPSATEARVEDITENGYYFWNKTKWVKQTGQNGEEWVYNPTNQRIELKRSGKGDFHNYVYYDNTTGQYINTDTFDNIKVYEKGALANKSLSEITNAKNINFYNSINIPLFTRPDNKKIKNLSFRHTSIKQGEDADFFYNNISSIDIIDNSNNYERIYPESTSANLFGTGTITNSIAYVGGVNTANQQNISGFISGLLGTSSIGGSGKINRVIGVAGRNFFSGKNGSIIDNSSSGYFHSYMPNEDSSLIKNYTGIYSYLSNSSNNSGTGVSMVGIHNTVVQGGNTKYPSIYGIYSKAIIEKSAMSPDNLYGLYLEDITGATTGNYAIFTNAGNIRFGDLAYTAPDTKRLVVTNSKGILSTSEVSLVDLETLWENDTQNYQVVLKKNSVGKPREYNGDKRNSVTISDAGAITAKGFIGYNGASIFPDYVFEKYYKGYSNIKTDYNFHNLTSVETFIKKNGHLPGYKSAKEIAKEGLIDIGATQLTNIEKIEELYLYTIEQEKKIEAQQKQIEELKVLVNQLISK